MFLLHRKRIAKVVLCSTFILSLIGCGLSKGGGLFGGGGEGSGSNSSVQGAGGSGQFPFSGTIRSISLGASSASCGFASIIIDGPDSKTLPSTSARSTVFSISNPGPGASASCLARRIFDFSPSLEAIVPGAKVSGTFDFDGSFQIIRTIQVGTTQNTSSSGGHNAN